MKQHHILKIGIVLITVLFFSCENEFDYGKIINAVKTVAYSNVSQTTAEVSGNVITDNGENLILYSRLYITLAAAIFELSNEYEVRKYLLSGLIFDTRLITELELVSMSWFMKTKMESNKLFNFIYLIAL